MNQPYRFFRQCLLAVTLAGSALGALAAPINYHVTLDTRSAALPATGLLDLTFGALIGAAPATATVRNFSSNVGAVAYSDGAVVDNGNGSFVIGNDTSNILNYLDLAASFGGFINFDLAFDDGFLTGSGFNSTFAVSLLDDSFQYLGSPLGDLTFELVPGAGITVKSNSPFATVSAVPEPSELLLMMTGLGLVGFMVRRRKAAAAQ